VSRTQSARNLILSAAAPAVAVLVVAIFAGYAIWGQNGLIAFPRYSSDIAKREVELASLKREETRLLNHKQLLRRGDADLSDEMTRGATGMIGQDEYILVPGR